MKHSLVSPEDQPVTFVELFFDLVFVFSVTQIVGLLAHNLSWIGVGQSILVFWLVWWAWTQFTWALNAANTEHPWIDFWTLVATAIAFLMAVNLPGAFEGLGFWFALPYVLVRVVGLAIYIVVARANHDGHRAAVTTFATVSVGGLAAAPAGGLAGGTTQYWLWGMTIFLDVIAAYVGGQEEGWELHPEHFAERHGLFVIIALGESLIVAAAGLTGLEWSVGTLSLAVMAVAVTCALWWSYFPGPKPALETGLCEADPARQGGVARDAFSLFHFPMMLGVIALSVAVEEAVLHPTEPLHVESKLALAVSIPLFVGGAGLAVWRAAGRILGLRLGASVATALAVYLVSGIPSAVHFGIAFAGVLVILFFERWDHPEGFVAAVD